MVYADNGILYSNGNKRTINTNNSSFSYLNVFMNNVWLLLRFRLSFNWYEVGPENLHF